ncbi:hypothetical protein [Streptomyces syringium]|uniref:hypothetical protein n=1 Tax=Streptomyces syringium TaxID=76729 RepID=UPI0037D76017
MWAENQVTQLAEGSRNWNVPPYGSPEWLRLPPAHPLRFAAVIEAAELWRHHAATEERLARLAEDDPDSWHAEVTAEANAEARRMADQLLRTRTAAELEAARIHRPVRPLRATPGWPPIAVPGQPGRYLHPHERTA